MNATAAAEILSTLCNEYFEPETELNFLAFENPFQILIMTILSAQTTDKQVNAVRDDLFCQYPDPKALADARPEEVMRIIRSTGFYRTKAKNIIAASQMLVDRYEGVVPATMEELLILPGVGRKTANIVLNHAYGVNIGIAVDTHVARLAVRIGFSDATSPVRIELDLCALFPKKMWQYVNFLLISHGRAVCTAKKPACDRCVIRDLCRSADCFAEKRD